MKMTRIPLLAKSSAMYLPIPPLPPVTTATLSSNLISLVHLAPLKYCLEKAKLRTN